MLLDTRYGTYGGIYVPETMIPALSELETAFSAAREDRAFIEELDCLLSTYAGRPTPLYHAANLTELYGANIYLKREDLLHGGAHKTNNALGQGLLARSMGKKRIIAETGAGQHGVATAMVGALLGMPVSIYMGALDIERQHQNVLRMKLLGARVIAVETGSCTLKDAINEALRDWVANLENTYYLIGTAAGPHPYPTMVRRFQKVIGEEIREQFRQLRNKLPDHVVACVGGGSNAIGAFAAFLDDGLDQRVRLTGVEPLGEGLASGRHGAVLGHGSPGALHGMKSMVLQDTDGQILEAHSIAAGLDYPSVGPEHAHLKEQGRVSYEGVTDSEAVAAFLDLTTAEGIIPALESSHALACAKKLAAGCDPGTDIVVNLSGRGDKDLHTVERFLREEKKECRID